MKRLAKILLLIITLFVFSGIVVSGADEFVETGSAGYRVVERLEQMNCYLMYYIIKI